MSWKGKLGWGFVSLLIVSAIAYGFWPKPVLVDTEPVRVGALEVGFTEEGRTRVVDRFVVSAPLNSTLGRIELEVGDSVEAGQEVCALTPVPASLLDARSHAEATHRLEAANAAFDEARERIESAAADQAYWAGELDRQANLVEKDISSRELFERTRTKARQAEAQLRSARFGADVTRYQVEIARSTLDHSSGTDGESPPERIALRSPVTGAVLKRYRESESVVTAGSPLLEIGDPTSLEIEVEVLSRDAVQLQPGMKVRFERWGGESPILGRVRVVEPVGFTKISALGVEEQRVLVICSFNETTDETRRLGDGYRVEGTFILWEEDDVLQVPTSSLFEIPEGGWAVFAIIEGRARQRRVEIGQRSGLATQILSGLDRGETVISHPDEEIEDGTRVGVR